MDDFKQRAADALALLPEDMQETAVAYLFEQAEKLRALKEALQEGLDDVAAGRMQPWDKNDFLRRARAQSPVAE